MTYNSSQELESYVSVYDAIPEEWKEAQPFLVEQLKKVSDAINIRKIGWLLDVETLNGESFIPGTKDTQGYRSVLSKVVPFGPVVVGVNTRAHGVTVDANFTLIELYGSATDSVAMTGSPINQPNITYDATNIYITVTKAYDRVNAFFSYIQEL